MDLGEELKDELILSKNKYYGNDRDYSRNNGGPTIFTDVLRKGHNYLERRIAIEGSLELVYESCGGISIGTR